MPSARALRRSIRMRPLVRLLHVLALVLLIAFTASSQTTAEQSAPTASISGTVNLGGKPARGVRVVALQGNLYEKRRTVSAVTDADGHYQLQGINSGNCTITVDAPSFA